jgi:signal transduction histidine kinase
LVDLSLDNIMRLYKLSSLGKLIGGLIHNINGPLQNIGLDLEMSSYMLKDNSSPPEEKTEKLHARLGRIEEELGRLNNMIKIASSRTVLIEEENAYININDYLQQELSFLTANLYFKHNIDIQLNLTDNPPLAQNLPRNSLQALSWLLHILADDMEKNGLTQFILETELKTDLLKISFSTLKGTLSQDFIRLLEQTKSESDKIGCEDEEVGILLVLTVFKRGGISIKTKNKSSRSEITMTFPLMK